MSTPRLKQLQAMLADSPGDAFLQFAIAKEYEKMGDEENAYRYYTELLENDPDYVGLYYHLGKWHERRDQPEKARQIYEKGMEAARRLDDRHALDELSAARLILGDEDED